VRNVSQPQSRGLNRFGEEADAGEGMPGRGTLGRGCEEDERARWGEPLGENGESVSTAGEVAAWLGDHGVGQGPR